MTEARKDRRAPASLKVKYKSESVDDFVDLLAGDVSRGGIFIKTKKPLDPGALLKFEFQLQNGEPMIFGVGRVAWRRMEQAGRAPLPAGMGIKFIKLNGQSRSVIEQIESKHGQGSRYEQTDGAEIATSISSLPPEPGVSVSQAAPGTQSLAAVSGDPKLDPSAVSRPHSSSPPLRQARVSEFKATTATTPTFRPPPPAAGSVPPSRASAAAGPRDAGPSAAPRRSAAARSTARDASEFLASAFSVGGAGQEVRSQAHAQAERARQDPRSVDLANELFGDLNEPGAKPQADAALDRDPTLGDLRLPAPDADEAAGLPNLHEHEDEHEADEASAHASVHAAPTKRPPRPDGTVANDQLSLSLGNGAAEPPPRTGSSNARVLWGGLLALLCVALGAGLFHLQHSKPAAAGVTPAAATAAEPGGINDTTTPAVVAWAVDSEPTGAEITVDGQPAGTTPATLKLTEGKTVELRLHRAGFATKGEAVSVAASMPARTFALDPLPYEIVVSEPAGATVKVHDKSVEAPAPLELGVLEPDVDAVTVTIDKPGFHRATRKVARSEFHEAQQALRAELRVALKPHTPERKPAPAPSPAALRAAPPPEPPAPPEPATKPVVEVKPVAPPPPAPEDPPPPEPTSVPVPPATASVENQALAEPQPSPAAPSAPPPAPPEPQPGDSL